MAKTQAQLEARVLRLWKVDGDGQTASAEESVMATTAVETAQAELEEKEIAYWSLTAIPDAVFEQVARYSAGVGSVDAVPQNEWASYASLQMAALHELRRMTSRPATGEPMRTEYF
jgi:hypothetical protein